jgi:hypothetical protein
MQALAMHKQRSMVPMPSKRTSAHYGQQQQQQQPQQQPSSHPQQQPRSSRQPRERQMPPNDPHPSGAIFTLIYCYVLAECLYATNDVYHVRLLDRFVLSFSKDTSLCVPIVSEICGCGVPCFRIFFLPHRLEVT